MKKYFKSKRRRSNILGKLFLYLVIILCINVLTNVIPVTDIVTNDLNISFNKKRIIYKLGLNYDYKEDIKDVFLEHEVNIRKKIYIYNTHQSEEYVNYDVLKASYKIKEVLNEYDIDVDIEDTNIANELKKNNYNYNQSYRVTRELLLSRLDNYDLYIDLHRDSSSHNTTTTVIDNKPYAKVMFVIGKKHLTYHDNYTVVSTINNNLKNINTSLSRGIFTRENSSFNQDLNGNVILIELGGVENTEEEVNNTIYELCNSIRYYLDE